MSAKVHKLKKQMNNAKYKQQMKPLSEFRINLLQVAGDDNIIPKKNLLGFSSSSFCSSIAHVHLLKPNILLLVYFFFKRKSIGTGLPRWLNGKESACNTRDTGYTGSILGWKDFSEEGMTTHSSILAWRIPWIRLQSMGLQRVRYD